MRAERDDDAVRRHPQRALACRPNSPRVGRRLMQLAERAGDHARYAGSRIEIGRRADALEIAEHFSQQRLHDDLRAEFAAVTEAATPARPR